MTTSSDDKQAAGNEGSGRRTAFWIFFTFVIWIFTFRGFFTGTFELSSDASSYYDHTKFFIENWGKGVFPLWDPYWFYGTPNDFFLRRIGAFNPFYLIILFFKSLGASFTLAYMWFLGCYYWSGMMAFYLLAMRIYHNRFLAFAGYLMLLFSALGTRLFDSYMMLVTVPLIWFFYFLTAFSQTPRKHLFLGMSLSFMILAGTYIPFYFLIILGFFLVLFFLIYFNQIPKLWGRYAGFFREHRVLVLLSLTVLAFSFVPLLSFFHDTSRGQVLLPIRHGNADAGHILSVPKQTLDWGAVEDLLYSGYFSDLRLYKLAVVYVPFFSVIVLILGFIGRINRRAVFMFLLGVLLFCCIVPHGLPFYDFFYRHIFFLKLFRNLHFFIWFFLVPLFVLLVLEHWHMFTELISTDSRYRRPLLAYVVCVHVLVFFFIWSRNDAVASTYIMIVLSFIFWTLMVLRKMRFDDAGYALLTLIILVQPLEAYYYFSLKTIPHLMPYDYDFSYSSLKINNIDLQSSQKETLYYVSKDFNFIYQIISNPVLAKYLHHKFILVDRLQPVDRATAQDVLGRIFANDENRAVIIKNGLNLQSLKDNGPGDIDLHPSLNAQHLDGGLDGFKLLSFDANHARIAVDVPYKKFLIYNDCYDPNWRVMVNHHKALLYEANGAFKGTWIPAGKSVIEFCYGSWWQYTMNILLSILALVFLTGTIWFAL